MKLDATQIEHVQKVIREIHEYARHAMQLFVAFFTFFVAMNYATMGFLVRDSSSKAGAGKLISLIAGVFIYQNILAIVCCIVIGFYFFRADCRILGYQAMFDDSEEPSALPKRTYAAILVLSVLTFVRMIVVWACYPSLWKS